MHRKPKSIVNKSKRPFSIAVDLPRKCKECGEAQVEFTTIPYEAEVRHDGRLYQFTIPELEKHGMPGLRICLRLEELSLAPKGTWRSLMESGLAPQAAASILELPSHPISDDPYPERYKNLAVHGIDRGKISQGRLARFLRCDPVTARTIVAQCTTGKYVEEDGEQRTIKWKFHRSLLAESK